VIHYLQIRIYAEDLKDIIHEMPSQHYEGGASGSEQHVAKVPPSTDEAARKAWLRERWVRRQGGEANRFRDSLIKWYGPEKGAAVKFAEAFEVCEYGRQPKQEEIKVLFPFFP
jgi:hypothetical protein